MKSIKCIKRHRIINAAIKLFAAKGYYSTRTLDISKEANVSYGSLYQYFKSKDDILLAIFTDNWDILLRRLQEFNRTEDSPKSVITGIIDFIFTNYKKNPDLMKVLIMDLPRLNQFYRPEYQKLYHSFFSCMAEIVSEGQKKGIFNKKILPNIAVCTIYGAVDSAIFQNVYISEYAFVKFPIEEAKHQITEYLIPCYLSGESSE